MFDALRNTPAASLSPALWRSDQYYWFTAVLAARGLQTQTCRLVAVCLVSLGLIPVVLMASPLGPQGMQSQLAAVAIGVSCLAMAVVWLRHHWPTRALSLACVIVGSFAIGVSALIVTSPVLSFLVATTYVVLTGYVVCFHMPRLLVVSWTVALAVLGVLFLRLGSTDPALAGCAVGVVLLLNVFTAFACRSGIKLLQPDAFHGDIEQLTGLLHRDAFYRGVATLLASRSRSDDRYLVVVAVNIDSFSLLLGLSGSRGGNRARVTVSQALRETVRHNAIVAHISDDDFLVADTFTTADASPLVERIRGAITTTPQRLTASIGVVMTPLAPLAAEPPDEVVDKLIAIATTAIEQARMAGGNQVRYVLRPTLGEAEDGAEDDAEDDGDGYPPGTDDKTA